MRNEFPPFALLPFDPARRQVNRAALAAFSLLAAVSALVASPAARAESWPARPISVIVPFPPGGTTDVIARALGEELTRRLGQPVIVENRPGAGATVGAEFVARARADGYTLLVGAVHHTIAGSVYPKLNYDFGKSFAPITTVAMVPNVLVVNAATPVTTVAELVTLVKAEPGRATYGSNGNGTAQHLIGTQFGQLTGATLMHVPYRGSAPITTDLLGNQILMSFDTVTPVLPHIRSGKLRALAVTTASRSSALPEVPTLAEAGLTGFDIGTWFGMLAPVATPAPVLKRLETEMTAIIGSDDFRHRMADIGAEPIGGGADAMARQIQQETGRFAVLVREAGIRPE